MWNDFINPVIQEWFVDLLIWSDVLLLPAIPLLKNCKTMNFPDEGLFY